MHKALGVISNTIKKRKKEKKRVKEKNYSHSIKAKPQIIKLKLIQN
jgi:hypothetical protein